MALDPLQKGARKRRIGSSQAAAIAGLNPFGVGQYDVWAEMTGRLDPTIPAVESDALDLGRRLEPVVLDWCGDRLGRTLSRDQFRVHPNDWACVNADALVLDALGPPLGVEAKTSGLLGQPGYFAEWGTEGTDQVPRHVTVQVQHAMWVLGAQDDLPRIEAFIVPVLMLGGFKFYEVPRDDTVIDMLATLEERFYRTHIEGDTPPPFTASAETIRMFQRVPNKIVEIPDELVTAWQDAKDTADRAAAFADEAKRAVQTALGDAEEAVTPEGRRVTFYEQTRKAYAVGESRFRVLRYKKG